MSAGRMLAQTADSAKDGAEAVAVVARFVRGEKVTLTNVGSVCQNLTNERQLQAQSRSTSESATSSYAFLVVLKQYDYALPSGLRRPERFQHVATGRDGRRERRSRSHSAARCSDLGCSPHPLARLIWTGYPSDRENC